MNHYLLPKAAPRAGDHPAMIKAIEALLQAGVDVRRPANAESQLKVDETTSYYPGRGTIFVDGDKGALPKRGLDALFAHLGKQHLAELTIEI